MCFEQTKISVQLKSKYIPLLNSFSLRSLVKLCDRLCHKQQRFSSACSFTCDMLLFVSFRRGLATPTPCLTSTPSTPPSCASSVAMSSTSWTARTHSGGRADAMAGWASSLQSTSSLSITNPRQGHGTAIA